MTPGKAHEVKTKKNAGSVKAFLDGLENETRRKDAKAVLAIMKRVTGKRPSMWGDAIVGFGEYTQDYANGSTGRWPMVGFSPRKQNTVLYVLSGSRRDATLLERLGKHRTGTSCLYINKLADVDLQVLEELVTGTWEHMLAREARRQAKG